MPPSTPAPPEDHRLLFLVARARQVLLKRLSAELAEVAEITAPQAGALFYLRDHEVCTLTELSRGLGLDNSAITGLVRRLEARGLVTRSPCPRDRRAAALGLTATGRAAAERALPVVREHDAALREGHSAEEIDTFRRVLRGIVARDRQQDDGGDGRTRSPV